jgi:DNA invertase Pin-like site-specific DNA recombinase
MENSKKIGYMRVSSREQNEGRQLTKLLEEGIKIENIFLDKQSGKDFKRNGYEKMISLLEENSVVYVTSLDRLGRNYSEIMNQWKIITREKKADVVVLDMPLLDTRNKKDLLGTLISDLVLTILSYVAETERNFIKIRQREGIAEAKKRGVKFGRPSKKNPENFFSELNLVRQGKESVREASRKCGMSKSTFWEKSKKISF